MTAIERLSEKQSPQKLFELTFSAIDLYWDYFLEPPLNTVNITSRDPDDSGQIIEEVFTFQRIYDTAYFIRCVRNIFSLIDQQHPFRFPLGIVELQIYPALQERGVISIKHISPVNLVSEEEISLKKIRELDSLATAVTTHFQFNLLAILIAKSKTRYPLDPLPHQVKQLLTEAYGSVVGQELWQAGMMV